MSASAQAAPHQTGPTSITGKARVALNGLTHGATSEALILPGEKPEDLYALFTDMFEEFQPTSLRAAGLATDAVNARWMLLRRQRAFLNFEYALATAKPDTNTWDDDDFHRLNLRERYKVSAEHSLRRAMLNLKGLNKHQNPPVEMSWQEALAASRQEFVERYMNRPQAELDLDNAHMINGQPSCDQGISIEVVNGVTEINGVTNDQVRAEIARRAVGPYPVEVVSRSFIFENGVPEDFEWVKKRPEEELGPAKVYTFYLTLEAWNMVADWEDARPGRFPLAAAA